MGLTWAIPPSSGEGHGVSCRSWESGFHETCARSLGASCVDVQPLRKPGGSKRYASRHDRRSVVAHPATCGRARTTNVPAAMHRTTEPTRSSRWGGTDRAPGEPVPAVRGDDHRCVILHIRAMTTGPGGNLGARGQSMRALGHWRQGCRLHGHLGEAHPAGRWEQMRDNGNDNEPGCCGENSIPLRGRPDSKN
jgi:hypothetical protein